MHTFDAREETLNAATHAAGLALGVAGAPVVIYAAVRHGGAWEVWGCAVYAATLIAAYTASTLSHVAMRPRVRHTFRAADQALIFLFIAGSYTPIALAWLRAGPWWVLHALIWAVALAGFASKAVFGHRVHLGAVSTILYLLLGWMPLAAIWPLVGAIPGPLAIWILAGGLCYTAGLIFFRFDDRVRHFHAVWHLFVLGGTACHYLGILLYCTGMPVA